MTVSLGIDKVFQAHSISAASSTKAKRHTQKGQLVSEVYMAKVLQ